jgi:hypothetical protein
MHLKIIVKKNHFSEVSHMSVYYYHFQTMGGAQIGKKNTFHYIFGLISTFLIWKVFESNFFDKFG